MFSSDGKLLATADQNSRTYLWDVATRTLSFTLTGFGFGSHVESAAFSPDGKTLATGDSLGYVRLWDLATRSPVLPGKHEEAQDPEPSPRHRCRASGTDGSDDGNATSTYIRASDCDVAAARSSPG